MGGKFAYFQGRTVSFRECMCFLRGGSHFFERGWGNETMILYLFGKLAGSSDVCSFREALSQLVV